MAAKSQGSSAANHQKILLHLLNSVDENKYCCDCDAKGPRWASWNLGLFVCIRCAGIHRNLGVHISKVKSVNLDSWTAEQIESVIRMGNKKAREIYEAQLPAGHRRPQEDYALEQFIRNKYDKKMYADSKLLKESSFEKVDIEKYLAKINGARVKSGVKGTGQIAAPPSNKPSSNAAATKQSQPQQVPTTQSPMSQTYSTSATTQKIQNVDELLTFGSSPDGNGKQPQPAQKSYDDTQKPVVNVESNSSVNADLAGLIFESTQPSQNIPSNNDLFGQSQNGEDLFGSSSFSSSTSNEDKAKSNGKKTNQDILSLYATSTPPSIPPVTGNGSNSFGAIYPNTGAGFPQTSVGGPGGGISPYQWSQPISGSAFNTAAVSPYPPTNFNSTQPSSTNHMFVQNPMSNQFANMNLNPNLHQSGQAGMGYSQNGAPINVNPFASPVQGYAPQNSSLSHTNWSQPIGAPGYSYNSGMSQGMGNGAPPMFNNSLNAPQQQQQQSPRSQPQNVFAATQQVQVGPQQAMVNTTGFKPNTVPAATGGFAYGQSQQQSLWLN